MPVFTRRQLQMMLDELAPWLTRPKAVDLVKRIENANPNQSLPAEYELALGWGLSQIADMEVERSFGERRPDYYSPNTFKSGAFAIEVVALSDEGLSGENEMKRAANIISDFCSSVVRRSGKHLYFQFHEESGYESIEKGDRKTSEYFRRRCIKKDFQLDDETRSVLRSWLRPYPPARPIRIKSKQIDVVITWEENEHVHTNTWSSMPAVAHDVKKNPIYERLKDKSQKQFKSVPSGVGRCFFLCDAGCRLLSELKPISYNPFTVSGHDIICEFLANSKVDIVCVLSPRRPYSFNPLSREEPLQWYLNIFDSREIVPDGEYENLSALPGKLPRPYLHGYQARSWHQQKMCDPQERGHYLGTHYISGEKFMTARISSRGLQEFLAGRLTREQFDRWILGEHNVFESNLKEGRPVSGVRLESSGVDKDDDHLVFEFGVDPSAAPLRVPGTPNNPRQVAVEVTRCFDLGRMRRRNGPSKYLQTVRNCLRKLFAKVGAGR